MATYVELEGIRTWYDEHGAGDPLVLLHPALTDARAFGHNLDALSASFTRIYPSDAATATLPMSTARSATS